MYADCKGALNQINSVWRTFEHKGQRMTKRQVTAILEFAIEKGYRHTGQIPDEDIERIINENL